MDASTTRSEEQLLAWTSEHRLLFADSADALGEAHAGDPTLCEGWDVRTLTGHLLQPIRVPSWRFLLTAARVRSMARACDVIAARLSDRPLAAVAGELRRRAGERSRPWYIGAAGPFADSCIHLRDLTQPRGMDVTVPVERREAVVDVVTSPRGQESFLPARGFLDGVSWAATDADRVWGEGPVVAGTTEALAMTMTGRTAYLDQLGGDGVHVVRERLAGPRS
ncbi:maleylpyruvate isomerase mycothiol-dependent enzyme family protein [Ornithinimicrobium avium]|uniref:Maleylpyruvate isomerase family mycothiol-dependent enzyme n=1 Tax=Ornithinimicrobium avium TaxID=2283195 RepID=A0A345NM87_9MICO|nr:maleylpyruvate isomerase family mycothiol-dependent enzyme [Ornithinimicrobium avium]AXH96145.1 maleylpyruvate isomerase family mycothiol-dependent enzyme [Ornithinimicrobium avium]